jgi:hypothetical protein
VLDLNAGFRGCQEPRLASVDDHFADDYVGKQAIPWRIEHAAKNAAPTTSKPAASSPSQSATDA